MTIPTLRLFFLTFRGLRAPWKIHGRTCIDFRRIKARGEERWGFEWKDHPSSLETSWNIGWAWSWIVSNCWVKHFCKKKRDLGKNRHFFWMMCPLRKKSMFVYSALREIIVFIQGIQTAYKFGQVPGSIWSQFFEAGTLSSCFMVWRFPLNVQALWSPHTCVF